MDDKELLANALYTIKESGEMEWALKEWNKKAAADKTWANCKTYFSTEYANRRKHAAIETRQTSFGRANQATEQPQADEELEMAAVTHEIIQQLCSQDAKDLKEVVQQQKQMLETNQKMMTQLMQSVLQIKTGQAQPAPAPGGGGERKSRYAD